MNLADLTWVCEVCGDERRDECISVAKARRDMRGGAYIQVNLKYCNDRAECVVAAQGLANKRLHSIIISY